MQGERTEVLLPRLDSVVMGLASRINIATAVVVALMLPCSCTAFGSPRVGRTHAVDPPAVGGGDDTGTRFGGGMAEVSAHTPHLRPRALHAIPTD